MMTVEAVDRFLAEVRGQALREGTRYAREGRVGSLIGTRVSLTAIVEGSTGDYEIALWSDNGGIAHRCNCPSWCNPCKHQVAAALLLRERLSEVAEQPRPPKAAGRRARPAGTSISEPTPPAPEQRAGGLPAGLVVVEPEKARRLALEERVTTARREKLIVKPDKPPYLTVASHSGFAYRVHLRGGPSGPHGCDCPDFEANRLHTCKHVERVRAYLRSARLPPAHRRAAARPRIYLHFGELIEPRLLGVPRGRGSQAVRTGFDGQGMALRPVALEDAELVRWLEGFGAWVEDEALAWLRARMERKPKLPAKPFARVLPPLRLKPYRYQWHGAEFLARSGRALLADEMGLGKTAQAIMAAAALRRSARPIQRVTVVCPASLRGGWQDEIHRWLGEQALGLEGSTLTRARIIADRPAWLITHYEQVWRDYRVHQAHPPDLLIIDEAQRAKGLRTQTARVLKAIGARHVFALTGTPLENRLEDAYAIAQLIDQRLLPPLWQIDRDHFVRDQGRKRVVLYRGLADLRARLAPAFLRRRKEDVALELPQRLRSTLMMPMHPKVVTTYDDALAMVARIASKKVLLPVDLERIQRLLLIARRCCNGPHLLGQEVDDRSVPKLQELEQALRDLCLGERRKPVVFSEWTDMTERVELLCRRLRLPSFYLHGGVPIRRRPLLIRGFSEVDGPAVFVSTDAGGLGLNLQAAEVVINLDLPWNPARLEQRIARVHRIGSKRTIQELLLVTKESIEERILKLHETKRNVLDNLWSKDGEDTIEAPGGSGAFQEMLQALLQRQSVDAPIGDRSSDEAGAPGAVVPDEVAAWSSDAEEPGSELPKAAEAEPDHGERGPPVATTSLSAPGESRPALAVDAGAISAAVAAVAPTLPAEHRRSLALVFRALASALEQP
jgi:hypothetical protein